MSNNQMFCALVTVMALIAVYFKVHLDAKFDALYKRLDDIGRTLQGGK